MNLKQLITQFRIRTMDTVKPYLWPDTELGPWFTESEAEAAVRALLIHDTDTFDIKAGDTDPVNLPASLFDIQYAELRGADGKTYEITGTTRRALNQVTPGWRSRVGIPGNYIHDDKTLSLSAVPDQDYTLYLEFYRLPSRDFSSDNDEPEINEVHHLNLIDWVEFRAYAKPDPDAQNPKKSAEAEGRFVSYFGQRSTADIRRKQNANRPHRNRLQT